jgi:hypothetical protein
MRVLCAYTDLNPATEAALRKYAPGTDFIDVSGDDYAYWAAICERWTGQDDLLVVEHDIEIHDQVIPQMQACAEPWCSFAYRLWRPDAWCHNALGCTRFSAALQRSVSTVEIEQIQARWMIAAPTPKGVGYSAGIIAEGELCLCSGAGSPPCWRHIDYKIADTLEGRGPGQRTPLGVHVHEPPVCHMPVDKPVDEAAARVTGFPWHPNGSRPIEFPFIEPDRVFHSETLKDRPEWWPEKAPGVHLSVRDETGRELTLKDARDPAMTELAAKNFFPTDKVTFHGYWPAYQQIAQQIGPAGWVCEVGVWLGYSLKMWQALFPAGTVAGVDHDESAIWPDGTTRVVCEQDSDSLPGLLAEVSPGGWDLIVDDASHLGHLTRRTWELLWPLVKPGGWYVIEDWSIGLGVPPWNSDDNSMLRCAESFLPLLDAVDCDPDFIEYRHGLVIMHRKG